MNLRQISNSDSTNQRGVREVIELKLYLEIEPSHMNQETQGKPHRLS